MKKFFNLCMLAVFTLCFASQASAYEWVDIELGESYAVPGYTKFYGKFTATETKTLFEESISYVNVYTEEYVNEETPASALVSGRTWTGTYNPYTYSVPVVAGQTYYFVMDYQYQYDAWNFKLSAPVEFDIEKVEPAENGIVSTYVNGDGKIYVTFTQPPKGKIGYFRFGKTEGFSTTNSGSTACTYSIYGNTVAIDVQPVLLSLYANGLKAGDGVTLAIRMQDPDTGSYNWGGDTTGVHKLNFKAAGPALTLVSEKVPEKILSYMAPDNEDGKMELVFSGNLATDISADQIYFEYGDKESENEGDYAEFPIPFSVDGSKLTLDFTGVSRRRAELLPLSSLQPSTIDVRIKNLKDADGNFVMSSGQGTIGSFSYRINYEELPVVNITQEIIPATGSSLKNVESINWWFDNANNLSFDGVRFDFVNEDGEPQTIVVPMSEITNAALNDTEMDLTIVVPEAVKNGSNVVVTLNNLKSLDGQDHSAELSARYDAFTILSVVPAAGSVLEKLAKEQVVTVKSNYDESNPDMYLTYELRDLNPTDPDQEILLSSYMSKNDDGSHSFEVFYDMPLYLGHTYALRVNYFETEEDSHGNGGYEATPASYDDVKWTGSTEPFSFSTYTFESITPDPASPITDASQNEFTLVFDGLVSLAAEDCKILLGMGQSVPFESVTPVEPVDGYANTWVAKVSESTMEGIADYLSLSFKAYDMNGKIIEGNEGEEQGSYFRFNYFVTYNIPEFSCTPADGETVESLSKFELYFETGIFPSWQTSETIKLVTKTETVYEFTDEDFEYSDDIDEVTGDLFSKTITLTLPEEVTEDGVYTLIVPDKYFNLGSEMTAQFSKAQSFQYIVHAPEKPLAYTVDPAEGKIEYFYTAKITFTECSTMTYDRTKTWSFTFNDGPVTMPDGTAVSFMARGGRNYIQFGITSKNADGTAYHATQEGTYKVSIPANTLTFDGVLYDKEIVMTWTIGDTPEEPVSYDITFTPTHLEDQPHLESINMVWDNEDEVGLGAGKATLTKPDGSTVELPDADYGVEYNEMDQHLGDKHEAIGQYVVTFPAGYFVLGSDGRDEKEIKVTYNVVGPSEVESVIVAENGVYNVYDMKGYKLVDNGSIEDVKALSEGMYVINGQKYLLKK